MKKTQLLNLIKDHTNFIKREQIILNLLKFYNDNKRSVVIPNKVYEHFWDIFSEELIKKADFADKSVIAKDAEYLYEFLDTVTYMIQYGVEKGKYIQLQGNGIFCTLVITNNKKLATNLDQILKWSDFSNFQGW